MILNIVEISRNIIILTPKDNINYKILIIVILVKINSDLIFILLYKIFERAEIFGIYNRIRISIGIYSGNIRGKINYSTSTENRIKLIEN